MLGLTPAFVRHELLLVVLTWGYVDHFTSANPRHREEEPQNTNYDGTKKRAHDSQIAWAKENLKLSHGGPSQKQASGTSQPIKALHQDHHWVWGRTLHRAIKEETIAINRDWVYNQACRLSQDIHVVSHPFITFNYLLNWSINLGFQQFFWIYKLSHHKILAPTCPVAEEFLNQNFI